MSCLVSASYHMVVLRASSSSLVSQSLACSQIQGGSVTWASQSNVGKSFVIGANCCTGMLHLLHCRNAMAMLQRTHFEGHAPDNYGCAMFCSPQQHVRTAPCQNFRSFGLRD